MTTGEKLRAVRKAKGISQLCLAMRCGMIYQGRISEIEVGYVRKHREATLNKLAKALGVSVDEIRGDAE
jgi:transcriptional regulator with XRE-family HTH domain